jgi:hypothetical protein
MNFIIVVCIEFYNLIIIIFRFTNANANANAFSVGVCDDGGEWNDELAAPSVLFCSALLCSALLYSTLL